MQTRQAPTSQCGVLEATIYAIFGDMKGEISWLRVGVGIVAIITILLLVLP